MPQLRIALAQVNSTVGDLEANAAAVVEWTAKAAAAGASLVVFPEMMLTGYPVEDLALRASFVRASITAVHETARRLADAGLGEIAAVVGYLDHRSGLPPRVGVPAGSPLDAAAVLHGGSVVVTSAKHHLPNYGVFDEYRIFVPGDVVPVLRLTAWGEGRERETGSGGPQVDVAVAICEDLWQDGGPVAVARQARAGLIVVLNASPYERGKADQRLALCRRRAAEADAALAYVNMIGGQDELVFDGDSIVVNAAGAVLARGPQFAQALIVTDLELPAADGAPVRDLLADARDGTKITIRRVEIPGGSAVGLAEATARPTTLDGGFRAIGGSGPPGSGPPGSGVSLGDRALGDRAPGDRAPDSRAPGQHIASPGQPHPIWPRLPDLEEVYSALVTGLRDYVTKNRFRSVILALSGGIDSALTATVAADAIGPDQVHVVLMPSAFSSEHSLTDANELAKRQGLRARTVPITPMVDAFNADLHLEGLAAENLQARVRGMILMSLSNAEGHLVLATGNKSEFATGYSTLYGDSAGGFAPIKDVPKTLVWKLAKWRNERAAWDGDDPLIPENTIAKPPSAELRHGQLDSDSLPDYAVLDPLLDDYVQKDMGAAELIAAGHDPAQVERVIALVDRAEYKRRQSPPGPKISAKNFGRDRRLPITNRWREPFG